MLTRYEDVINLSFQIACYVGNNNAEVLASASVLACFSVIQRLYAPTLHMQ